LNCNKADLLIMKYMDGLISDEEIIKLKEHISVCDKCKEDFMVYNKILDEFSDNSNIINAPSDFEEQVMAKIDFVYSGNTERSINILCFIWGLFSVFAGLGTILIINKEKIIEFISNVPNLSGYLELISKAEIYAEEFKNSFISVVETTFNTCTHYIDSLKYVSLIIFVILIAAQYLIYKKGKVEV